MDQNVRLHRNGSVQDRDFFRKMLEVYGYLTGFVAVPLRNFHNGVYHFLLGGAVSLRREPEEIEVDTVENAGDGKNTNHPQKEPGGLLLTDGNAFQCHDAHILFPFFVPKY